MKLRIKLYLFLVIFVLLALTVYACRPSASETQICPYGYVGPNWQWCVVDEGAAQ